MALNLADSELSTTREAVPHVFNQVFVGLSKTSGAIEGGKGPVHEFGRAGQDFVDSGNHIIVDFNLDLESFDVNVWRKFDKSFVEVVDDVIHEDNHVLLVVSETRQTVTVAVQILQGFVDLVNHVVCASFLEHKGFVQHLRAALDVVIKVCFEGFDVTRKLLRQFVPVFLGDFFNVAGGLFELGAAELNQSAALLNSLQDRLGHARVYLIVVLVEVLLLETAPAQELVRQLVIGQYQFVWVLDAFLVVLQLWRFFVQELVHGIAVN